MALFQRNKNQLQESSGLLIDVILGSRVRDLGTDSKPEPVFEAWSPSYLESVRDAKEGNCNLTTYSTHYFASDI